MLASRRSGLEDSLRNAPVRRSRELKKEIVEHPHRSSSRQKHRSKYYSDEEEQDSTKNEVIEDKKLNDLMNNLNMQNEEKVESSAQVQEEVKPVESSEVQKQEDSMKPDKEPPVEFLSSSSIRRSRRKNNYEQYRTISRDDSESPVRDRRGKREPSESPVRDRRGKREPSESPVRDRRRRESPVRDRRRREPSESPVRDRRRREPSESPVRDRRRREPSESPVRDRRRREPSESPVRDRRRREPSESPVRDRRRREASESPVRDRRRREASESPVRSESEVETQDYPLLKLSKSSISRLAKYCNVQTMSSNVYEGIRALCGEFIYESLLASNKKSNGEIVSYSILEPILEKRIGSEIPDLENNEIDIVTFSNYVKDLSAELNMQIKKEAILYLHNASEYYLIKLLRRAVDVCKNSRRSRVTMNDIKFASGR